MAYPYIVGLASMTALALALGGCSTSDGPGTDGSGGAPGSGGAADSGGTSGSAGTAGLSGRCPQAIPAPGAACAGVGSCIYRDCAGPGVVQALCNGSEIADVTTTACMATACADTSCPSGTICVLEFTNGTTTSRCVSDPCGSGPTGCDQACYRDLCSPGLMCYSTIAGARQEVDCQAP
ncbi:MAG: hypothetical protein WDO69_31080 [Pseudomonadota bacterium]